MPSSDDKKEDTETPLVPETNADGDVQNLTNNLQNDEQSYRDDPSHPGSLRNEHEGSSPNENAKTFVEDSGNEGSEGLNARYLSSVPYQYKPSLIQYESEPCTDYNFGLIRGYHREMYEEKKHGQFCACCQRNTHFPSRIRIRKRVFTLQVIGVFLGALFVFMGLAILLVGFAVLSDNAKEYFWESLNVPSQYTRVLALVGLSLLSLGTAFVSLFLLVPLCVKQTRLHNADHGSFSCVAGDLYIKNAEKTYNFSPNQFLYFDAAFYRKLFGHSKVKKVQPELAYEK